MVWLLKDPKIMSPLDPKSQLLSSSFSPTLQGSCEDNGRRGISFRTRRGLPLFKLRLFPIHVIPRCLVMRTKPPFDGCLCECCRPRCVSCKCASGCVYKHPHLPTIVRCPFSPQPATMGTTCYWIQGEERKAVYDPWKTYTGETGNRKEQKI